MMIIDLIIIVDDDCWLKERWPLHMEMMMFIMMLSERPCGEEHGFCFQRELSDKS